MVKLILVLTFGAMALSACNQTTYVRDGGGPEASRATGANGQHDRYMQQMSAPMDDTQSDADAILTTLPGGDRHVAYGLNKDLFHLAPRCVMVLPMDQRQVDAEAARVIEGAVTRHLSYRFRQVISASDVERRQRSAAIRPSDLKLLGRSLRCGMAMDIKSAGFEQTYALVWAHARLPLALQLRRVSNGQALWWGRHAAERSEGGLPLGVLSLPLEAFSASKFAGDKDVLPSMADDAARRVLESLPSLPMG